MKRETLLGVLAGMTLAVSTVAGPLQAETVADDATASEASEAPEGQTFDPGETPAAAAPSENPFADLEPTHVDPSAAPAADLEPTGLAATPDPETAKTTDPGTSVDPPTPPAAADPGVETRATTASSATPPEAEASREANTRRPTITLGPVGIDSHGRRGRIHTVARGHTLWDISEAYLGTPWVWPSIWDENARISNPHLIFPKDRIWITSTEMRLISEEEAEALISSADNPPALEPAPEPAVEVVAEEPQDVVPAAMEQLPVRLRGGDRAQVGDTGEKVHVSWRQSMSFMSSTALEGASSIVDSPEPRTWLAERDSVYIGLGEGDVAKGDLFTIFADPLPIRDPVDGTLLGYHVDVLGRLEIVALTGETAIGRIVESVSEIERGALVTPYEPVPPVVSVKRAPQDLEGRIVFMPANRTVTAQTDYVYLNQGAIHGLEIGSGLQVIDHGGVAFDRARRADVLTPDSTVADLVVVSVQPESAAALVTHATRELTAGDTVRGAGTLTVR